MVCRCSFFCSNSAIWGMYLIRVWSIFVVVLTLYFVMYYTAELWILGTVQLKAGLSKSVLRC